MRARIEPEAREELREAKRWYDRQRRGLGVELLGAVRAAVERIRAAPDGFPLLDGSPDLRRAFVERFPYVILYLVRDGCVRILVIAHQRRAPSTKEKAARERRRRV